MNKQKIIPIALGVILLGALAFFIFSDLNKTSSIKSIFSPKIDVGEDDSKAEVVTPDQSNIVLPDLDREFVVPDIYSQEIKENSLKQYKEMVSKLKEDPNLRNEWLQLALFRYSADDYKGAEEVWLYMIKVWTFDHVAFGNLANLYSNYLTDDQKAIDFYIMALERRPDNLNYYDGLYNIFRFKLNNETDAISLLDQGSKLLPKEIYFPTKLGEHYRDTGNQAKAKTFFEEALKLAQELKLVEIENYVKEELSKL